MCCTEPSAAGLVPDSAASSKKPESTGTRRRSGAGRTAGWATLPLAGVFHLVRTFVFWHFVSKTNSNGSRRTKGRVCSIASRRIKNNHRPHCPERAQRLWKWPTIDCADDPDEMTSLCGARVRVRAITVKAALSFLHQLPLHDTKINCTSALPVAQGPRPSGKFSFFITRCKYSVPRQIL